MTPEELYIVLSQIFPQNKVDSVCEVEPTCRRRGFCAEKQKLPVLDFDKIKDEYYHGQRVLTPSSVDAVALGSSKSRFCFIEMKGWKNYIRYLDKQRYDIPQTVAGYNLSVKLEDSQKLCIAITADPDLFAKLPILFLLVTDIDVHTHGIEAFHDWLTALTETSSDTYSQCISNAKQTLDSEIHIEHQFIKCTDFDNVMALL